MGKDELEKIKDQTEENKKQKREAECYMMNKFVKLKKHFTYE
jgi:hypothetical protein